VIELLTLSLRAILALSLFWFGALLGHHVDAIRLSRGLSTANAALPLWDLRTNKSDLLMFVSAVCNNGKIFLLRFFLFLALEIICAYSYLWLLLKNKFKEWQYRVNVIILVNTVLCTFTIRFDRKRKTYHCMNKI
jgi:hypothetical protein